MTKLIKNKIHNQLTQPRTAKIESCCFAVCNLVLGKNAKLKCHNISDLRNRKYKINVSKTEISCNKVLLDKNSDVFCYI